MLTIKSQLKKKREIIPSQCKGYATNTKMNFFKIIILTWCKVKPQDEGITKINGQELMPYMQ